MDFVQPRQRERLTLDLHYDSIIIGGNPQALEAAKITSFPAFHSRPGVPLPFDGDGDMYEYTGFILAMMGNFPPPAERIVIDDTGAALLYGKMRQIGRVTFDRAYVFDADEVADNVPSEMIIAEHVEKRAVIDWFMARNGQPVLQSLPNTITDPDNDVVNIIKFPDDVQWYRKGKAKRRNVAAISFMTDEEANGVEFDFSPQLVQFKVMDMIAGRPLVIEWKRRDQYSFDYMECENFGKFEFCSPTMTMAEVRNKFMPMHNYEELLRFEKLSQLFSSMDYNHVFHLVSPKNVAYYLSAAELQRYMFRAFKAMGPRGLHVPLHVMNKEADAKMDGVRMAVDKFVEHYNGKA